jgi:outer membrane lipoprotein-sorting protein
LTAFLFLWCQLSGTSHAFLENFFDQLKSFKVQITQVTESPYLGATTAKGWLELQRGAGFRMAFIEGERKRFAYDGVTYIEHDLDADLLTSLPASELHREPFIEILVHGKPFAEQFLVDQLADKSGATVFRFRPRENAEEEASFSWRLIFNPQSKLSAFVLEDSEGHHTTLSFQDWDFTVLFPEGHFKVDVPAIPSP